MAEPEEVIIDAARHATETVGRLWRRRQVDRPDDVTTWLDEHRSRLQLLITAVHAVELPVHVAQPPAPPNLLRRLLQRLPKRLVQLAALPSNDGTRVYLPRRLEPGEALSAARWFRLLALQQAGRAIRGSATLPALEAAGLTHELYLLCEAAAVDRRIAVELPGLIPDLLRARADTLAGRPPLKLFTPQERAVEVQYRQLLQEPTLEAACLPETATPQASWQWAEQRARQISDAHRGPFRCLFRDTWLGALLPCPTTRETLIEASGGDKDQSASTANAGHLARRPQVRQPEEDEDDEQPGMWMLQMDDPQEHVEDPMGMQRPVDQDAGNKPDDTADSLSELPEARLIATPERAKEVFVSDDPPDSLAQLANSELPTGISYPEWDYRTATYHVPGTTVRPQTCELGDPAWAVRVIEQRKHQLDEVRRRFEGLRPRRVQINRQRDGDEVDISAYVEAHADFLAGHAIEDRFYQATIAARRDVAIMLLIDISGSTEAWVGEGLRIIDVEKEALLVCCHALDTLGDPYAIQAFSGEGPHGVKVWSLKAFEERESATLQRRIAALEPQDHTRAGAAMRHVTTLLSERTEQHRLLLLLSDGKPNDVDVYEGRYGVQDMRQAVVEAAAAGVNTFCLTVDRDAPLYLNGIFGPGQHATLRHPRQLPAALVDVLRRLLLQ